MKHLLALPLIVISACVPISQQLVAMGENSNGKPVSGVLMTTTEGSTAIMIVDIDTYNHGNCKGQSRKSTLTAIKTSMRLECDSGRTGSANILHDYINGRDIISYQVASERGQVVTGRSTVVQ